MKKAFFTFLKVPTYEICVFTPAAWVNRLKDDCEFTQY